ncbi:MAG: arginine-tRNA-protein transferase [Saprospiraceae bacterium]|nr:arginine-tRNA-protein transferase [Pyrinomonadaceae bacterium]
MFKNDFHYINEEFHAENLLPLQMDAVWAEGWRHFGIHFFRYNLGMYEVDIRRVIPLRIRLSDFKLSKSQRRILRRNADLQTIIDPIHVTSEIEELFDRHKSRFKQGVPDSIYDFLSHEPANVPCEAMEVCVYNNEKLIAASFFAVGERSISAIYGMFEPEETARSLGIFTMLKEIEFAIGSGKDFYYQGYCYEGESFYDYKKRFAGIEAFDWNGKWEKF